ncbi:MFS transporter [Paracoccus sp. IB05]|uniref:MFS transporter n=1 Tax=Paracoccus sp. IB05 TaxID=2779367 RepID=UPI0018E7A6CF|nr:MFS transporter [Paracoccus sp. IB05]MBJ2149892.1 MFS transporter [Paracoccus sp. IB05]
MTDAGLSAAHDHPGPGWECRFRAIFGGQAVSLIGSAMTQFALIWWITDSTGSVSALALAGLVALLPQALLGPLGGTLADRYSRRVIMIAADLISALCMLVPASFLPRAAGLNQTLMGIITIAAAPLGALAISVMPIGYALSVDVVTAVLGIVPLLVYAIPQARMPKDQRSSLWAEFREGLGSAGMILGGIIVTALAPKRLVLWILWGFALSCFAFALAALMPGRMFWLAVVFWVVSSVAFILGNAPLTVLIQTRVPNQLQGRALSLMATMMGLAAPVGLASATPVGERIGIRWLFVAMGVVSGLVALAGFLSPVLLAKAVPPEPDRR